MARTTSWMWGLGTGAALTYWFDPDRGRRRRALLGDRLVRVARVERELLGKALRDLEHRRQGLEHRARALFRRHDAADAVLEGRIRATLGRKCSHPRSLEVAVQDGVATLSGPILAREADGVLAAARGVPGVARVDDRLDRHEQPGNVPGLQGQGLHVPRPRRRFSGERWMPGVRLVAGGLGLASSLAGLTRRGPLGLGLLGAGTMLFLRALDDRPLRALFSQTHDERGLIEVTKTIGIEAPVEAVYGYFRNFENFPRVMDHVAEVQAKNAHSSWKVRGPAGTLVDFDVELVRDERNRLIEWRTLPGQGFEHRGVVRFSPVNAASTRLEVRIAYSLPGGRLGDLVAGWFRVDPKRALDDDLLRFKSVLERGRTHAHRHAVTREELRPV